MSTMLRATRVDTSWARLKLALSAVAGIAAYHVVLVAPFAALLLLNPWTRYYGVWPALAGVALVWWTLHPWREAVGRPVSRRGALASSTRSTCSPTASAHRASTRSG